MKNIKNIFPLYIILTLIIGLFGCVQNDNDKTRLSKKDLKLVNSAILEIVVPKKEDSRVKYERALPWHQLSFKERNDKFYSIGTAFFISQKRLVSAAHVFGLDDFSTWKEFFVRTVDGKTFKVSQIYKYSQYRDLVEFELESYPSQIFPLKINKKVEIGDTVFAIGNAQGEGISVRGGQVASFTPEPVNGNWNYIRFSSPASPGNSGGPLVNINAEVVGIIVMKNRSENYNYALPIEEIEKASEKEAEFFEGNLTVFDGTQTESGDWKIYLPLPAKTSDLELKSQENKNLFYGDLLTKLKETKNDLLFPNHYMFRSYLRDQSLGKYFGAIQNDTSLREWTVEHVGMKKVRVAPHQFVHIAKGKLGHYEVLIEKPGSMELSDFISNSKLQMELLTTAMGFTRTIGKERVRILSYGEPNTVKKWTDGLGRKWQSSYWFITYNDIMYSLDCLPSPQGVLCLFDVENNSQFSRGYDFFKSYNVLEQTISYFGTLKQWKEFFELDKSLLPKNFPFELSYNGDLKNVNFNFNGINFKKLELDLTDSTVFTVFGGYSLNMPITTSFEAISVQTEDNEYEGFSFKRTFAPVETSSAEHSKRWKKIKSDKNPYNLKLFESDDIYYVKKSLLKSDDNAYVLSCFVEKEEQSKQLPKICKKQMAHIK